MNRVAAVLNMHWRNKRVWVITWLVTIINFLVELVIGTSVNNGHPLYTGGIAWPYLSTFIVGILIVWETFPLAVGFSVRRTDFLLGTAVYMLVVSAVNGILFFILSWIEAYSTHQWGMDLYVFNYPFLDGLSMIERVVVYIVPLLFLYTIGFSLGSVGLKFGRTGIFLLFGSAFVILSALAMVSTLYHLWSPIGLWFVRLSVTEAIGWMILVTLVFAGISYFLLRKTAV